MHKYDRLQSGKMRFFLTLNAAMRCLSGFSLTESGAEAYSQTFLLYRLCIIKPILLTSCLFATLFLLNCGKLAFQRIVSK
jgi:hypothetical protein